MCNFNNTQLTYRQDIDIRYRLFVLRKKDLKQPNSDLKSKLKIMINVLNETYCGTYFKCELTLK